jgi:glycosyltransferase involved in cell wall biosynthesis
MPENVPTELVIVANACTDETQTVVARWAERLPMPTRCVVEDEPGLSVARNRAIAEAGADRMVFLDDDIQLSPGWLAAMWEGFERYKADSVGGRISLWWEEVSEPDWFPPQMAGMFGQYEHGPAVKPFMTVNGGNFGFRRAVVDKIGGFRPELGRKKDMLLAGEESEWVERALAAGFNLYYLPEAAIRHWVPAARATREYVFKRAEGMGVSQIVMKPKRPWPQIFHTFIGRGWLIAKHGALAAVSRLKGSRRAAVYHAAMVRIGWGGVKGLWQRYVQKKA